MSMYPDMYSFFDFDAFGAMEETVMVILAVCLAIMLFSSLYSILVYVLHAVGLYSIGKRRGIHNPWLAWIPVANVWMLGSISDQYQYVAKKKTKNRRKVLVGLMIALYASAIVIGIALGVSIGVAAVNGAVDQVVVPVVILILGYIALIVLAIVLTVFQYICYYDLFASCNPDNATVFLVLGIFFSFLLPYFVFACRKKDLGMPARQAPAQPAEPQYIPAPEVVEPEAVQQTEGSQEPVAAEEDFEPEEE